MDDARQLLQDILRALNAIPNAPVPRRYADSVRFSGTYDIAAEISRFLNNPAPTVAEETEFDPYRDPDTVRMLERAGIATHKFRR
jgi:hypothetical protein